MDRIGFEEGQPIEHNLISKAVENAQKRVEGQNFDIRKHLLEYDDVMNQQRQIIYGQRREILSGSDPQPYLEEAVEDVVDSILDSAIDEKTHPEEWDLKGLDDLIGSRFSLNLGLKALDPERDDIDREMLRTKILEGLRDHIRNKEESFGNRSWINSCVTSCSNRSTTTGKTISLPWTT